ncbi:MAG: hypothetical protein R3C28_28445 [Pirellulaceae bacterium]
MKRQSCKATVRRNGQYESLEGRLLFSVSVWEDSKVQELLSLASEDVEPNDSELFESDDRVVIPGDIDRDGQIESDDIDLVFQGIGTDNPRMDLNSDGQVDSRDVDYLVRNILETQYGDANLDGLVDTQDLVWIYIRGKYEADGANAGWRDGDFNGDGRFTTADLVKVISQESGDRFESNDTIETATPLGPLDDDVSVNRLSLDDIDWYSFEITRPTTGDSHITAEFDHSRGDIDLKLYDSRGWIVGESSSVTDAEHISMSDLAIGRYYLKVYGYRDATNSDYSIRIEAGKSRLAEPGRNLWLNFDGDFVPASSIRKWAQDWAFSPSLFTPNGLGLAVDPLYDDWEHREEVIERIMELVAEDLAPYGISVHRSYGGVVEDMGETTIFIGRNYGIGHRASDVDYGNNNRTDIAVVNQEWWGTKEDSALALADVVLHEAGHTYGLFHVETKVDDVLFPESMGIRYSEDNQDLWVQDTGFLDVTFVEYLDHGRGRGYQNAHQTMLSNFGVPQELQAPPTTLFQVDGNTLYVESNSLVLTVMEGEPAARWIEIAGQLLVVGRALRKLF